MRTSKATLGSWKVAWGSLPPSQRFDPLVSWRTGMAPERTLEGSLLDKPIYRYIMRAHICSIVAKGARSMDLSPEQQRRTVISSRIIDAPIDDVFDAYANPTKLVRWWGPNGFTLTTESIDLNEGGHWKFGFQGPDGTTYKNHLIFLRI